MCVDPGEECSDKECLCCSAVGAAEIDAGCLSAHKHI